ncbi:hypothetical protein EDD22DRAFT_957589 [Suillus occidentalis]|nr:hypothetical protein EDD22DRAFT_957589 [Suillus occidentalis]
MQRFVLLTALISLVITAAASPTPEGISKRSFERNQIDANFQRDLPEKREELGTAINYDDVD